MKVQFVSQTGSPGLILVFTGWAMDAAPLAALRRPGYDIAVLWDYRSLDTDWSFCSPYSEICIVAWSLGVYAAAASTAHLEDRVSCRIAVNGTLHPIHKTLGIAPETFEGTRLGLSERSLYKFYRRVAGSREAFEAFSAAMPRRDTGETAEELDVFLEGRLPAAAVTRCDLAIIGARDAIFPPDHQIRAWQGYQIMVIDSPHLPDMQAIIDRFIIDKQQATERFGRGRHSYSGAAPVQRTVAARLGAMAARHAVCAAPGARALEIGCGSGLLTEHLRHQLAEGSTLELWDIAGEAPASGPGISFRRCDAEVAIGTREEASLDLIASASTIQWFNSPANFLRRCSRALRPGGYLLLSSFTDGNLAEVAHATGHSLHIPTAEQWLAMMPEELEVVECSTYTHRLCFGSSIEVFAHLKATGVNSLGRTASPHTSLKAAISGYPEAPDGSYQAGYRPILMLMRKKQ